MIDLGQTQRVPSFRNTLIDKVDRDRLEGKRYVCSGSRVCRERFLSPRYVDIFVQLDVDLGACAIIIVTVRQDVSCESVRASQAAAA